MKIYTKGGDKGMTSLYGGKRISKSDLRIESYGTIDELNSFIGLLISALSDNHQLATLEAIQQELFVIGSHLAAGSNHDFKLPEIPLTSIEHMEQQIDLMNEQVPPLKHFVLPGGSYSISLAHVCRTVSRRAERRCVHLSLEEQVPEILIKYLNRLSDYFFMLARYIATLEQVEEIKWMP